MATTKLTERICKDAQFDDSEGGNHYVWDADLPGFGLRVAPGGTKSFVIRYRIEGRQRIKKLCGQAKVPVARARLEAQRLLADAAFGADPYPEQDAKARPLTVAELCDEWIEKYAKAHRKNIKTPERRLKQNVVAMFGKVRADELTAADVAAIHRKKGIDEGKKPEANRVLALLGTVYRWGGKRDLVPDGYNPTEGVDRFKEKSRDRILRKEQIKPFWEAVEADDNAYIAGAIKLMLLTGARRGEVLAARWEDFDREGKTLLFRDTKNGTDHRLPLSAPALKTVEDLEAVRIAGNPYLICGPRDGEHLKDIRKGWNRILKRANIKGLTRHDLRRSFSTHMAGLNHAHPVVEWLLNHKLEGVASVYTHLHSGSPAVREAVEDYGGWMMRQIHGEGGKIVELREVGG